VRKAGKRINGGETGKSIEQGGTMRYRYFGLFLIVMFALLQSSCGNQPGAPGSEGDTGVLLSATIIGDDNGNATNDVDAVPDICPDLTAEPFFRHAATITISALLERPDLTILPGNLYIEQYTIDYVASPDSVGAPPIEQYREYTTVALLMPEAGATTPATTTFTGMLVDIPRKLQYTNDMLSGQFSSSQNNPAILNNYTAIYTFYGKNDFGTSFKFKASVPFVIGHFDNCG
jgi:hypothetical protein